MRSSDLANVIVPYANLSAAFPDGHEVASIWGECHILDPFLQFDCFV